MFKPYMVKVLYIENGVKTELSGFGKDIDDYVWARTAKRLVFEKFGILPDYLENIDLESVDIANLKNIDLEKKEWKDFKLNIKTIPCYVYRCNL